ncbi:MAG TPA: DUF222 domain-containing protein [Streptosporangiaceae bacterium]
MSTTPTFASTSEAMAMVLAGLGYLAAADPAAMTARTQADHLRGLEQAHAVSTAARAGILAAFTAGRGYAADADYSPTSWLIHRTGVTEGAARAHLAWGRRVDGHPRMVAALAEGDVLTESMARTVCEWSGKLPQDGRDTADQILIAAARAGARQQDLAELAAEIYARSLRDAPDDDTPGFDDRKVTVQTTIYAAGIIAGDLTAECAAVVTAVLESLSAPRGAEDTRTREQRYHDALEEAMTRLVAAGLLPDRAGQPVKAMVHVSLPELRAMDGGSVLQGEWITAVRAKWAAHRAAASVGGSDGAAWLDGSAARGMTCDASVIPVVTGELDAGVLDDLVNLCMQLHRLDQEADRGRTTRTGPCPRPRPRRGPRQVRPPPRRPAMTAACPPPARAAGRPGRCSSTRSSAKPWTWSPGPAAWPPSCAATSWAPAWPGRPCRWMWAAARTSRPRSAAR